MTRKLHYVGTLPAELVTSDRAVMEWVLDRSEGHPVTAVPRDLDPDWIMDYLLARKDQDVFEVKRQGDYADYSDFPSYGLRSGHTLEPQHVSMDRIGRISEVVDAFNALQSGRAELAATKVQISQPNPLDLAMFVFAGAAVSTGFPVGKAVRRSGLLIAALRHLPVFTDAVLEEMRTVIAQHGDHVLFQLESPLALLSMVKAQQLRSQWAIAPLVARQLAGVIGRMHEIAADIAVHLCYGDYKHKSLLSPRDLAPAVTLLNHTARQLNRSGVPLPPVHIPCAYGAEPAPRDPAFYAPLGKLDPGWRLIAGVVSPDSTEDSADALTHFERASGRTAYAVATACGLGRCSVEDTALAAANMIAVAGADETHD
ncbi:hypothetical protein ACQP1G_24935 [Nocardia sp. CA-107356]|uniref:hypothetical protein n=1 Tax=Nocardia sp. CA-107356 TaxID=3239972 RepID=UPI003D8F9E56